MALVLDTVGGIRHFTEYHLDMSADDTLLDVDRVEKAADTIATQQIRCVLKGTSTAELLAMDERNRTEVLRQLKALPGVSQRQIARLTGLNRNMIQRA